MKQGTNEKTPSPSEYNVEHFVTLFDNNYLPIGLALYRSLLDKQQPFHLWVLCMDDLVEQNLLKLALPSISLIPLRDVEDAALLAVKPLRNRAEYCWTLTPFTPQFVFDRDLTIERVTYLDADIFFFDKPSILIDEFEKSEKHVLVTEHAYDPQYDKSRASGKFCVQFMTFRKTEYAIRVMRWWQEKCLEWCYEKPNADRLGDQKYLDQWPALFGDYIHILQQKEKTLAPWNIRYYETRQDKPARPVLYHYHGFRIISHDIALLYSGYRIGKSLDYIYKPYLDCISNIFLILERAEIPIPVLPLSRDIYTRLLFLKRKLFNGVGYANFSGV